MARRTGYQVYAVDGQLVADTSHTVTGDETGSQSGVPITAARGLELGYAEIVADYGSTSLAVTEADVPGLAVTVTCDGITPVELEFWGVCQKQQNVGAFLVYLYEGSTVLQAAVCIPVVGAVNEQTGAYLKRRLVPSAGSHAYKVRVALTTVGGKITTASGPAFIQVTSR